MRDLNRIIIHTAADGRDGGKSDTTAAEIRQWHLDRGWSDIGYHYVIRKNGGIELGRPLERIGAHVKHHNHDSIGICLSGHGDLVAATDEQWESLISLTKQLCHDHSIPAQKIFNHRDFTNQKTCPGNKIDARQLREDLIASIEDGGEGAIPIAQLVMVRYNETEKRTADEKLQAFLNEVGEFGLKEDGFAGQDTSDAFNAVFGYRLKGDHRDS